MQFRTIAAKYPGICNRCNGPIAVGQSIRYAGPRRLYHFASECPAGSPAPTGADYTDTVDDAPDAPTDDQIFMSAAIAGNIQAEFNALLARPAQLTDPAVLKYAGPTPWTGQIGAPMPAPEAVPVAQMAAQTPAAARQAPIVRRPAPQPIDPNDLF